MLKTLNEKYLASMVLHAVGDAMGYKNGSWEFKFSGVDIHEELGELGGISKLKLNPSWKHIFC
jgi:ADP-ribosylarginine hydrolase